MSLKYEDLPPDAERVVEGLRDTGYHFHTAVADVVDNSIAADADNIHLWLEQDYKGHITLRLYDDGAGMDRGGLLNALRYGSKIRPSKESLGKFGLGLKTASTAFCRRLTVVSRNKADAPLHMAVWDLDEVKDRGWQVLIGPAGADETKLFEKVLSGKHGTLVMWDKVDRVMKKFKVATGARARKAFEQIVDGNPNGKLRQQGLKQHLATVYQRFLDPKDKRARTVKMSVNGAAIAAWDPFCESVSRTEGDDEADVPFADGKMAPIRIRGFILPRREEFPTPAQADAALIENDRQGIYVYRENRLIHGPDWLTFYVKEPHMTLFRVEFSFDHRLDDAFQIDIKKSQIILDENIATFVTDFLTPRRRLASDIYRKGTREDIKKKAEDAHDVSNRNIAENEGDLTQPGIKNLNAQTGVATLVNRTGEVRLKLKIGVAQKKEEVHVQPVESINDGLLWEPAFVDGHCAVRINRGHPYYSKVYVPNLKSGVTIQGMDALLWGLSVAELNCATEKTQEMFSDLRYDISRNLKKLVEKLPDPVLNGDEPDAD
jgi:hypothetical protein